MQNFVFRGILTEANLEEDGWIPPHDPVGKVGERTGINLEDFSLQIRNQALRMAEVYTFFFSFENSVRELVESRLREALGSQWWDNGVPQAVRKKVDLRRDKEKANRWHQARGGSDIYYADFGDLSRVIISNWELFEDLFPAQDWISSRLDDLEMSRNVIAHNGILADVEVNRIELYLRDWLEQVG
ncbi:MAG: hypothetical protein IIA91_02770 [Chloroflexi bacterium]|nr:hypothetical protein [Chloroflexota bacterium]